jgi:hypothetical protein
MALNLLGNIRNDCERVMLDGSNSQSQSGPEKDIDKDHSAKLAYGITTRFSKNVPSVTTGSDFIITAGLVYEYLTGKDPNPDGDGVGLERSCRRVLKDITEARRLADQKKAEELASLIYTGRVTD